MQDVGSTTEELQNQEHDKKYGRVDWQAKEKVPDVI
jgi:hypothetical protein